jgi:hypothetical protein
MNNVFIFAVHSLKLPFHCSPYEYSYSATDKALAPGAAGSAVSEVRSTSAGVLASSAPLPEPLRRTIFAQDGAQDGGAYCLAVFTWLVTSSVRVCKYHANSILI